MNQPVPEQKEDDLSDEEFMEEFRQVQADIAKAGGQAGEIRKLASEIVTEVRTSTAFTERRTSARWLGPIMVASVIAGALIAGLLSLIVFTQAAARCSDDSGFCGLVTPQSTQQQRVIEDVVLTTLEGVQWIENGGTVESYIAIQAEIDPATTNTLLAFKDGQWIIRYAEGVDSLGRDATRHIGKDPAEVFPSPEAKMFREKIGGAVLESGEPQIVEGQLPGGDPFVTRVYRVGENAVMFSTTVLRSGDS